MAPAVPFALLGVVQLTAVAVWLGLAAAGCVPGVRRKAAPLLVLGASAMAVAEALTALKLDVTLYDPFAWLRLGGLTLIALGIAPSGLQPPTALPAILAPLGARPLPALLGGAAGALASGAALVRGLRRGANRQLAAALSVGLLFTAVATALADPARHSTDAALALLAARAAGSVVLGLALVLIARMTLLGKLLGAIVAGVVAMAVGAVAVVGVGVATEVQRDQSQRLLSVASGEQASLSSLQSRASTFSQVMPLFCVNPATLAGCQGLLQVFSDPSYFAVIVRPGTGAVPVPGTGTTPLDTTALLQLAGSKPVKEALKRSAMAKAPPVGPLLLNGSPQQLVEIAAEPVRAPTASPRSKPMAVAVYGIGVGGRYLKTLQQQTGYGVSVIAGGQLLASSLDAQVAPPTATSAGSYKRTAASTQLLDESLSQQLENLGPTANLVVPAQGASPTVAFVPINPAGNEDARIATLAISQPASVALATQRSVLRRLVLTALVVLLVVALFAFAMANRIADPVRRLTEAAGRVRGGDLDAEVAVRSRDEVGTLARAFDAMTSSLRGLTGDLRAAADQEAALRARLEAVVGSMTDGLITTDADDVVTSANPTALALLACAATDVIGRRLVDALDLRGQDGEPLSGSPGATRVDTDALLRRADGTELPVRVAVAPLRDAPGWVVVISDRTREREIERMKTEFLSNVSHELRTPLTPIQGYAEMLARRPGLPPEQVAGFVAEILAGTARMSRAVGLLVDVAALEAGRVTSQRRTLRVGKLVDERLAAWRALYPARAADFRRRVSAGLPDIEVDPHWLVKALDELADNAAKHTPAGTSIVLAASVTNDGQVRLAVRDSGPGIDTSRLGELLGDFSQADSSETRHVGGMGLGLGFVSRVAQQLGVALRVSSVAGKGSEFALDLSVTAAPPRERRRRE